MTWFKTDDRFAQHKKVRELRTKGARVYADALAVWLVCGVGCAAQLGDTDVTPGFVSDVDLDGLAPIKPQAARVAAEALVEARLWKRVDGGYLFHDWDEYQPTPDSVQSKRDKWKKDKAKARGKGRGHAHASEVVSEVDTAVESTAKSPPCPSTPVPGPVPPPSVVSETPPETTLRDHVVVRWGQSFERHRGTISARDDASARELARLLASNAQRVGKPPEVILVELLEAYWRDPWTTQRASVPSLRNLVSQHDRLLAGLTAAKPTVADVDYDPSTQTPTTPAQERAQREWLAAGCPRIRRAS